MAKRNREEELTLRVRLYLKAKMAKSEMTYAELAERMAVDGFVETKRSLASKLARGTFGAVFFIAALRAIGETKIDFDKV